MHTWPPESTDAIDRAMLGFSATWKLKRRKNMQKMSKNIWKGKKGGGGRFSDHENFRRHWWANCKANSSPVWDLTGCMMEYETFEADEATPGPVLVWPEPFSSAAMRAGSRITLLPTSPRSKLNMGLNLLQLTRNVITWTGSALWTLSETSRAYCYDFTGFFF